jgi:hypothetical protein
MKMAEMDYATARRTYAYFLEGDGGELFADFVADSVRFDGLPGLYACLPDQGYDLPEEGGWIMIKEPPTTSIPDPPLYSMWLAKPVFYGRTLVGRRGIVPGGKRTKVNWPMLRARIQTPYGELTLLPCEYVVVKHMPEWLDSIGDGVSLHFMGPGVVEGDMVERVFQMRSRGLRQRDALTLLLPEVTDQGFAWLSLDGTGAERYIEGVST